MSIWAGPIVWPVTRRIWHDPSRNVPRPARPVSRVGLGQGIRPTVLSTTRPIPTGGTATTRYLGYTGYVPHGLRLAPSPYFAYSPSPASALPRSLRPNPNHLPVGAWRLSALLDRSPPPAVVVVSGARSLRPRKDQRLRPPRIVLLPDPLSPVDRCCHLRCSESPIA